MKIELCPLADSKHLQLSGWFSRSGTFTDHQDSITTQLFQAAKIERESGDEKLAQSIEVIAHAMGMRVDTSDPAAPFRPLFYLDDARTGELTDFTDAHLAIFEVIAGRTENATIKARLFDLLWVRQRKVECAKKAIDATLTLANESFGNEEDWGSSCAKALERAVQLWHQVGKDPIIRDSIIETFRSGLRLDRPEPENFVRFKLFEILADGRIVENIQAWLKVAETLCQSSIEQNHFRKARSYLDAAIALAKAGKDKPKVQKLQIRKVDLFGLEARTMHESGAATHIVQELYYAAITANSDLAKLVGSRKQVIESLHKELTNVQSVSRQELKATEFSINLKDPLQALRREVESLDTVSGITHLAAQTRPPSKESILASAKRSVARYPLQYMFSGVVVDDDGRVVNRSPGISATEESSEQALLKIEAQKYFSMQMLTVGNCINVVRNDLRLRFDIDQIAIDPILETNPFVPADRINLYRSGIWFGFNGDWIASMHILIPQLENSLRVFLASCGLLSTKIDQRKLTEQGLDLNSMLYKPDVSTLLGEDLTFMLQMIFVDHAGPNFRNMLAHGLLSDESFGVRQDHSCAFVWALAIHLCVLLKDGYFAVLNRALLPSPDGSNDNSNKGSRGG